MSSWLLVTALHICSEMKCMQRDVFNICSLYVECRRSFSCHWFWQMALDSFDVWTMKVLPLLIS
eukprot:3197394-Amphidinium_carterae.1